MKNPFVTFLLLVPGLSAAQTSAPAAYPYRIKGQLGQLNAPAKVYLTNGPQLLDSASLTQGRFELRGTTPYPGSATLVLERQGRLQSGMREMMLGGTLRKYFLNRPTGPACFWNRAR